MKPTSFFGTLLLLTLFCSGALQAQDRQLTFEDIMRWEDLSGEVISGNGQWLAYEVWPDRGDGEVRVRSVEGDTGYTLELGEDPAITPDGQWVGAYREVPFGAEGDDAPVQGMFLLNTGSGDVQEIDSVSSFQFSEDGRWLAIRRMLADSVSEAYDDNGHLGAPLRLMNLQSGANEELSFVSDMAFDSTSTWLSYSVVDTSGSGNGLYLRELSGGGATHTAAAMEDALFDNLAWDHDTGRLAFTSAPLDSTYFSGTADLQLWSSDGMQTRTLVAGSEVPEQWWLRSDNDLEWTRDNNRLFFGVQNRELMEADLPGSGDSGEEDEGEADPYDMQEILDEKSVDVWHWDDPLIKTHERETWNQRKGQLYRAVYHLDTDEYVQLATEEVPDVEANHDPEVTLASSSMPYRKQMTWDGFYSDYYIMDLRTGEKTLITERLDGGVELSPGGNYALYFRDKDWHLYDVGEESTQNLTDGMEVPFWDEDHDYPSPTPGYGVAGWIEGEEQVLVYDKYDIWSFDTESGEAANLTRDGRQRHLTYRIERLDYDRDYFAPDERLLLEAFYDREKYEGLFSMRLDRRGTTELLGEPLNYEVGQQADDADRILFTKESYDLYPNIWVSEGMDFSETRQLTDLHDNLHADYNWGRAEIIQWTDVKGDTVRGAVIKPDDYDPDQRYPVMTYFYRFFSQRAYEFNNITNDDRPVLPQYVSDGYVVFLPDVHFTVGFPGPSSVKSLVPGILKLIDMGIAHPDKLGLHGHSWSGYQTAHIITETDIFDAAIAGAPVSNMTSAYSGIRWGSGLARQFQYEQTQSRIGGSLWEYPERYIENSPVFFADRIETPLMLMFGDEDTAVPWYQGIELYLAMRRLGKDAVFLQYHNEPHHLQRYGNRLDYAVKMKEYFDHYLRGMPAPDWIEEGVPYRGGN
ncbi:MAG: prolyl oligopeptidase family serine peptidase [Balneolaceae bacterium]|nr:prolyl oligopeptidase family serine peptidase [Balneolaceae bacterium]